MIDEPEHPDWVTIEVPRWVAALGDRGVRAAVVLACIALSGFVAIGVGWRGVDGQTTVALQLPFVVSAGFGGIALIATAAVLLSVHLRRRRAAERRAELEEIIRSTAGVADGLATRRPR